MKSFSGCNLSSVEVGIAEGDHLWKNLITTIKASAFELYNNAYQKYYLQDPAALRYNLCLASSNAYFKATILLAKIGENLTSIL